MENSNVIITKESMKEEIQDEILIALVKENPILYNKKHPDYKNHEVKKDTWNMIKVQCGMSSVEEIENRWNQLRNYFGKKLREMKVKSASGSSGGTNAKKVEWYLMGAMSFLIPHISHRRGRSSMGNVNFSTSFTLSTSSEISSPTSSQPSISSKVCNIDFVQNDSVDIVDDIVDHTSSTNESIACSDSTTVEIKPETKYVLLKKKKVPDLDIFAKKKQKNVENVENLLAQSTSALINLATVVHKSISESVPNKINEHKYKSNPYAESISVAFDQVPVMKQVDCLIAILNVIKSYQAVQADLVQH